MQTITDFIEKEYGSRNWVLHRRCAGIVERYGKDVICLTQKQYSRLEKMTDLANAENHNACPVIEKMLGSHDGAVNAIRTLLEAGFRVEYSPKCKLATLYADTLYQENIRSVRARYPDDSRDNLPGPTILPLRLVVSNTDICNPGYMLVKPIAILKMCACLDYQSCESDDWSNTVAYRLLDRIKDAAIQALPGYDDAPSDFYLPTLARAA